MLAVFILWVISRCLHTEELVTTWNVASFSAIPSCTRYFTLHGLSAVYNVRGSSQLLYGTMVRCFALHKTGKLSVRSAESTARLRCVPRFKNWGLIWAPWDFISVNLMLCKEALLFLPFIACGTITFTHSAGLELGRAASWDSIYHRIMPILASIHSQHTCTLYENDWKVRSKKTPSERNWPIVLQKKNGGAGSMQNVHTVFNRRAVVGWAFCVHML